MPDFDVKGAKDAGFSDAEIADVLAGQSNFDIAGAREAGFDDANIIQTITTGKPFRDVGQVDAGILGAGDALGGLLSTVAGAPVDALSFIQDQTLGRIDPSLGAGPEPFGGSKSIRSGLTAVGATPPQDISTLPPEVRPAFIAGEVLGGAAVPGLGVAGIPAKAAGILKPVVNFAINSPGRFFAAETASAVGAAAGGAGAEFVNPDDPVTRFLSEVAGGFFSPGAIVARSGKGAKGAIDNLIKSFTKSGRENKAAEVINGIVSEVGENPEDIIKLLDRADIQGTRLTAGQKTGSPALLAVESKLAQRSPKFAGEAEELATGSLKTLRELTDNLTKSGDPAALRVAAKMRQTYFDDLLDRRLQDAGQDALEARAAIGSETRADLANISTNAKTVLSDALKDARKVENELWGKIPKEINIGTDGLLGATNRVREKLLPSENLPVLVQDEITRMVDDGSNVGQALRFRSRMLSMGRTAKAQGDFDLKNTLDTLSDGILQDLDALPGGIADEARAFSRTLHEKFTNTFAGDVAGKSKQGGERIAAEVMLERAFGSGGTKGELQFRQLEDASNFPNHIFGEPMLDTQEKFLRVAAQNTADNTGRVNPAKLQEFMSKNQVTLDKFPDLKKSLRDANSAEVAFKGVEQATQTATKAIQQRAAFANLIKTDDPIVAVGQVLTGQNTRRNYTQLAKLAKKSGPGAVAGLRSSTLKNAFDKATNSTGDFSFKRLSQILKTGLSGEGQGLSSLMRQNGVMDKAASTRLDSVVKRALEIEGALGNQKRLDKLLDNPDALFDLVTRIVGAKVGSAGIAGGSAGSSLIAASAGSQFARNFAEKIPATKVNEVLEQAAMNPKFMSMLLKKTRTIKQRADIERQINAFLISAGLQEESE